MLICHKVLLLKMVIDDILIPLQSEGLVRFARDYVISLLLRTQMNERTGLSDASAWKLNFV